MYRTVCNGNRSVRSNTVCIIHQRTITSMHYRIITQLACVFLSRVIYGSPSIQRAIHPSPTQQPSSLCYCSCINVTYQHKMLHFAQKHARARAINVTQSNTITVIHRAEESPEHMLRFFLLHVSMCLCMWHVCSVGHATNTCTHALFSYGSRWRARGCADL